MHGMQAVAADNGSGIFQMLAIPATCCQMAKGVIRNYPKTLLRLVFNIHITVATTITGERIAAIESAVYGSASYCRRHRNMDIENQPEECLWIIPDDTFSHLATGRWYRKHLKNATSVIRCNSLHAMHALARSGAGLAVLPCYLGEGTKELRRLSDPLEGESVDLWVHVSQDTHQMARVRIVMEFLVDRLQSQAAAIEFNPVA